MSMIQKIKTARLELGDTVSTSTTPDDGFMDAVVSKIVRHPDGSLWAEMFRPYVLTSDTVYGSVEVGSAYVIPTVGFEQYQVRMDERNTVWLKRRATHTKKEA